MSEEAGHQEQPPIAPVQTAKNEPSANVQEKTFRPGRLTPRPSFLENLANSRDRQFMLDRRNSSELNRYFVCHRCSDGLPLTRVKLGS